MRKRISYRPYNKAPVCSMNEYCNEKLVLDSLHISRSRKSASPSNLKVMFWLCKPNTHENAIALEDLFPLSS